MHRQAFALNPAANRVLRDVFDEARDSMGISHSFQHLLRIWIGAAVLSGIQQTRKAVQET
ncbi:MAG: hypothetical protein WAN46_05060 [Gammaproteobacteria bacterium]